MTANWSNSHTLGKQKPFRIVCDLDQIRENNNTTNKKMRHSFELIANGLRSNEREIAEDRTTIDSFHSLSHSLRWMIGADDLY